MQKGKNEDMMKIEKIKQEGEMSMGRESEGSRRERTGIYSFSLVTHSVLPLGFLPCGRDLLGNNLKPLYFTRIFFFPVYTAESQGFEINGNVPCLARRYWNTERRLAQGSTVEERRAEKKKEKETDRRRFKRTDRYRSISKPLIFTPSHYIQKCKFSHN